MTEPQMNADKARALLYGALAKAQGAYPPIPKNRTGTKTNPETGEIETWQYADLDEELMTVRGPLSQNGLAFYQCTAKVEGSNSLDLLTYIVHEGGGSISSCIPLPGPDSFIDRTQYGAIQSLMRRYQAEAILGLTSYHETEAQLDALIASASAAAAVNQEMKPGTGKKKAAQVPEQSAFYDQAKFDASIDEWRKAVAKGVTTPEKIIAMIESMDVLTDDQRETILAIEVPTP